MHKLGEDELAFSNEKTHDKIEAEMDFGKCLGASMEKYSESKEKPRGARHRNSPVELSATAIRCVIS